MLVFIQSQYRNAVISHLDKLAVLTQIYIHNEYFQTKNQL